MNAARCLSSHCAVIELPAAPRAAKRDVSMRIILIAAITARAISGEERFTVVCLPPSGGATFFAICASCLALTDGEPITTTRA